MSVGSTTLSQGPKDNPCSGSTLAHPSKESKGHLLSREGDGICFLGCKGIVFIDYLEKGRIINSKYYPDLLKQFQKAIKAKQPRKLTKGVLFHKGNGPAHRSVIAMAAGHDCDLTLLDHLPFPPDLATLDYFLFQNM